MEDKKLNSGSLYEPQDEESQTLSTAEFSPEISDSDTIESSKLTVKKSSKRTQSASTSSKNANITKQKNESKQTTTQSNTDFAFEQVPKEDVVWEDDNSIITNSTDTQKDSQAIQASSNINNFSDCQPTKESNSTPTDSNKSQQPEGENMNATNTRFNKQTTFDNTDENGCCQKCNENSKSFESGQSILSKIKMPSFKNLKEAFTTTSKAVIDKAKNVSKIVSNTLALRKEFFARTSNFIDLTDGKKVRGIKDGSTIKFLSEYRLDTTHSYYCDGLTYKICPKKDAEKVKFRCGSNPESLTCHVATFEIIITPIVNMDERFDEYEQLVRNYDPNLIEYLLQTKLEIVELFVDFRKAVAQKVRALELYERIISKTAKFCPHAAQIVAGIVSNIR